MSQWGNTYANTSVPIWAPTALKQAPTRLNANAMYDTLQPLSNSIVDAFAITTTDTDSSDRYAHTGQVLETIGAGPVISVNIIDGGYGYANGQTVLFNKFNSTPDRGLSNTVITLTTNPAGNVVSATVTTPGMWTSHPVDEGSGGTYTGGGSGLTLSLNFGGRFGRRTYETLVATTIIN